MSTPEDDAKVAQCVSVFAAAALHRAGLKIVSEQSAEQLDVPALEQLATVLSELVRARSETLVDVLDEKDLLTHELEVKHVLVDGLTARADSLRSGSTTPPPVVAPAAQMPKPFTARLRGMFLKRASPSPSPDAP